MEKLPEEDYVISCPKKRVTFGSVQVKTVHSLGTTGRRRGGSLMTSKVPFNCESDLTEEVNKTRNMDYSPGGHV